MSRIALALGAGGARGIAHIPVLEALDELGIEVAAYAGASVGAVASVLHASGMRRAEIREHLIARTSSKLDLALVLLREADEPTMYMIPSEVWADPKQPFVSRDYEGLKSDPEYGLTVSAETLRELAGYRFQGSLPALTGA